MSLMTLAMIKKVARESMPKNLPRQILTALATCKDDEQALVILEEVLLGTWAIAVEVGIEAVELERKMRAERGFGDG